MPANRVRASPRPRSTRIAPYERTADIDVPSQDKPPQTAPTAHPNQNHAVAPGRAPEAIAPLFKITDHEETMLVRLAVKWASSRKLSLPLFQADLVASYERHQDWYADSPDGYRMTPVDTERRLQDFETRWRSERAFRASSSDLAQAVGLWMKKTRDVEEAERARRETEVKEVQRKNNLVDDEEKAKVSASLEAGLPLTSAPCWRRLADGGVGGIPDEGGKGANAISRQHTRKDIQAEANDDNNPMDYYASDADSAESTESEYDEVTELRERNK